MFEHGRHSCVVDDGQRRRSGFLHSHSDVRSDQHFGRGRETRHGRAESEDFHERHARHQFAGVYHEHGYKLLGQVRKTLINSCVRSTRSYPFYTLFHSRSSAVETICVPTASREEPTRRASCSTASTSSAANEEEKALKNKRTPKPSGVQVQSVKILKLNKNKKVDQATSVDTTKTKGERKASEASSQADGDEEAAKVKPQPASSNRHKSHLAKGKAHSSDAASRSKPELTSSKKKNLAKCVKNKK